MVNIIVWSAAATQGPRDAWWYPIIVGLFGLIVVAFCFTRLKRPAVIVDQSGVIVRRLFSETSVPWSEISEFKLRVGWPAVLRLTRGDHLPVSGITAVRFSHASQLANQKLIDQLNSMVTMHHGSSR